MEWILDPEHSKQELIWLVGYLHLSHIPHKLCYQTRKCLRFPLSVPFTATDTRGPFGGSDKEGHWLPCAIIISNCLVPKPQITLEISRTSVVYLHE